MNSPNELLAILKEGSSWVYQLFWEVCSCESKKIENLLQQVWWEEWKTAEQAEQVINTKFELCDRNHNLVDWLFYIDISLDNLSSFLKKSKLFPGCCAERSPKNTAASCEKRRNCDVCQVKHPSGLNDYKAKTKKSP